MKTFLVLHTERVGIRVRGKNTAGEYTVTMRVGLETKPTTYYTGDKDDAIHTAEAMFFAARRMTKGVK